LPSISFSHVSARHNAARRALPPKPEALLHWLIAMAGRFLSPLGVFLSFLFFSPGSSGQALMGPLLETFLAKSFYVLQQISPLPSSSPSGIGKTLKSILPSPGNESPVFLRLGGICPFGLSFLPWIEEGLQAVPSSTNRIEVRQLILGGA